MADLGDFVAAAHDLADVAADIQRRYFRQPLAIESKPDDSPVTVADREAEAAMRDVIGRRFPDHGVFGEEFGRTDIGQEFVWVLDPIDGTKLFITGRPLFGTLIALLQNGRPLVGIVDHSILRERLVGISGQRATLNGRPIATRRCPDLAQAYLCSTSPHTFREGHEADAFDRLRRAIKLPVYSSDCYAYGLIACGLLDIGFDTEFQPYDYCALVPVIEGAGGVITDWNGAPLGLESDGRILAAGDPAAHAAVLGML